MSTAVNALERPKIDIGIRLVADAWRGARGPQHRPPTGTRAVTAIKPQRPGRKSGIYRIAGIGDDGGDVIAKRCPRCTGDIERLVYERILPRLDLPALRYYGSFEEPDGGFCWLFMEDAGPTKLTASDRVLAAEWLARLHASATPLADQVPLPDRGPAHYLAHLTAGMTIIGALLRDLALPDDLRSPMRALLRLGERMEARWASICSPCDCAPLTLVHGDFARQNLRLRHTPTGAQLVALDWETAGWGPAAADIPYWPMRLSRRRDPADPRPPRWDGTVPLDAYARYACGAWGSMGDLERVAQAGAVFRTVAAVRWAAEQMRGGGVVRGGETMRWAPEFLTRALAELDC